MRPAVTMDSETYRRPAVDQKRSAGAARQPLPDTRYPHFAHGAADGVRDPREAHPDGAVGFGSYETGGRMRTAMLIVFAVVALSAIAAIGWMQYQSREGEYPHFEISEPDRSVPALAKSVAR